ncbi:MAG: nucleoside triphosphate pyrophosphohydrolase [Armatimonadota bacterium]
MKIVGLGPGSRNAISVAALDILRRFSGESALFLRTVHHPVVDELRREGIRFSSFDEVYDSADSLEAVYASIAKTLADRARQTPEIVYAVPGHPMVAERSVELLLGLAAEQGLEVEIVPSPSFVDACVEALRLPIDAGIQLIDAQTCPLPIPNPNLPVLIYQIDDRSVASSVKLALLEVLPDETDVCLVKAAGVEGAECVQRLPLYHLDRTDVDHLTTLYVPPVPLSRRRPLWHDFVDVVARLRAPDGCPWDREQTHDSLRRYLLEEAYEVIEAIDEKDMEHLCEELGDVLLQVALHSQMASETGDFTINDVIARITHKLIRRHPHVFAGMTVANADEVLRNWERIKASEEVGQQRLSIMDGIPNSMPALMRALEVSKRAVSVGFEWERIEDVWAKLHEEIDELKQAVAADAPERVSSELGDVLFTIVNLARWMGVNAEEALRTMVDRFVVRFRYMEDSLSKAGRQLGDVPLHELDRLWEQAKQEFP